MAYLPHFSVQLFVIYYVYCFLHSLPTSNQAKVPSCTEHPIKSYLFRSNQMVNLVMNSPPLTVCEVIEDWSKETILGSLIFQRRQQRLELFQRVQSRDLACGRISHFFFPLTSIYQFKTNYTYEMLFNFYFKFFCSVITRSINNNFYIFLVLQSLRSQFFSHNHASALMTLVTTMFKVPCSILYSNFN